MPAMRRARLRRRMPPVGSAALRTRRDARQTVDDPSSLAVLLAALAAAGVAAGLIAGLLGVGGGIVVVPVLYHVFGLVGVDEDVRMHLAVGTSLATIVPTSLSSLRAHARRGAVDGAVLRSWGPWVALGVVAGTAVAAVSEGEVLTAVFAVVALLIAAYMAFGKETWRLGDAPPTGLRRAGAASAIGGFSAMMGIGGGTLTVPVLTLHGVPVHRAVGTASAVGLIIALPGALGFAAAGWGDPDLPPYSAGFVSLAGLALLTPSVVLAAPLGARLAHSLDRRWLRAAFAVFLAVTSARMFHQLLG